ncbi:MAG: hypothetical protein COT92_00045 [Candidatus Doudnabacteria bacterium CG10_big_fil_rev_8_21_14_0_10_42_18]|uniref:Uncharacterized protein n=1 Tax=Candidatus Doudnabacteria bacterium CG10_big_fil_rev_8_21_14_0_10_42_18 TaxID=1974552 RepID=A0A2H0VC03_9BACT|nr:MAG: hypothetical protein COT92_00045 [Candidatus Doudnabacteria bacterium CG10_big_fil_rev_8_21_14_0_10_42_18]
MTVEQGEHQQPEHSEIERRMNRKTGLSGDSLNVFMLLGYVATAKDNDTRDIFFGFALEEPILTYEGYLEEQNPRIAKAMLEASDNEKVRLFNQLVEEFNNARQRIRDEKDYSLIKKFWESAKTLITDE